MSPLRQACLETQERKVLWDSLGVHFLQKPLRVLVCMLQQQENLEALKETAARKASFQMCYHVITASALLCF